MVFAVTFNPRLPSISGIIVKHWRTITKDKKMLEMFPKPPMVAFKQPPNLKNMLCKAKLSVYRGRKQRVIPGIHSCTKCPMCIHIDPIKEYKSNQTKEKFKLKGEFTCKTTGVIYLLSCIKCQKQYVGQTGRILHDRIREHMYSIVKNEKTIGTHFNSKGHNHLDMRVTVIEKVIPNTNNYRLEREDWWIKTLKTKQPKGLNIND